MAQVHRGLDERAREYNNGGMSRLTAIAALTVICAACAHSPVIPTVTPRAPRRPTWGLSGQSNAVLLQPHLAPYADVIGYSESSRPISWWDAPSGSMWTRLVPTLDRPMDAFLWWQGEADIGGPVGGWDGGPMWLPHRGVYQAALADLTRRVRTVANRPDLLFVIIRVADARLDGEQDAFIAADRHAMAVQTRDIGFGDDGVHMLPAQYDQLAARLRSSLPPL